jgi:predicted aspartyl protease
MPWYRAGIWGCMNGWLRMTALPHSYCRWLSVALLTGATCVAAPTSSKVGEGRTVDQPVDLPAPTRHAIETDLLGVHITGPFYEPPLYASPTTLDRAGRIVVPVKVNGEGPFRFLLDTGANRSVVAPHMVGRLNLRQQSGEAQVLLSGVTGQSTVDTVSIKSIQAGEFKLQDLDVPVVGATMQGLDGVLGVDGLEDKRLRVNFLQDRVTIAVSRGEPAPPDFVTLPARFRHGRLLVVDAMVGSVKVKAVIDTGAEGTLGNEALRLALQRQYSGERGAGSADVQGVTADIQAGALIYSPLIRFQGVEIEGAKVAYGNFYVFKLWELQRQPALLVGMDMLGTVEELIVDYARRELQVKPRYKTLISGH